MIDSDLSSFALVFCASLLSSLAITPLLRTFCQKVGLVDCPDGRRKHQKEPVPLAGGLSVLCVIVISLTVVHLFDFGLKSTIFSDNRLANLVGAVLFIGLIGLIDDARGLRGRHKLVGQIIAVSILMQSGEFLIPKLELFGYIIDLGPFGTLFTVFWLLGVINAINLIDGMDGMLSSVGTIACLTFAAIALMTNQVMVGFFALTLAGALFGFLWYNKPPATVYLGDCGSMMIGLILGALSIQGSLKTPTTVALAPALALFVLPIFDTMAAITRRKLTGRSIYTTDRGHLHHCLMRSGLTRVRVLMLVALLGIIGAFGALATALWRTDVFALLGAVAVVITLVSTRLFGHAEMLLVKERLLAKYASFRHGHKNDRDHSLQVRLQGSANWDHIWSEMTSHAFTLNLRMISLDVNAPLIHENYHARWDRFGMKLEEPGEWKAELPLFLKGQVIGKLVAVGRREDSDPIWIKLTQLANLVEQAEEGASVLTSRREPAIKTANQPEYSLPSGVL